MEQKRCFEEQLQEYLQDQSSFFAKDIIHAAEYKEFLQEARELWQKLFFMPQGIALEEAPGSKGVFYLCTYMMEDGERKELSHVPLDTRQSSRGKDVLHLMKLLIMETMDQYFARTLQKSMGKLELDPLICYQEEEYSQLNKEFPDQGTKK